ncbi:fluoride efflux transporter CrcB [Brevundimonas sp. BH3]|uniref:fluoride efflux transporter CrcB n=1 Tax=unclassified Brevundimonas TaxID=2622653 RepID=UPI00289B530D|nr:fluoride efflux transporter CrcB [Brevundimonas sp.]
MNHFLLVATGGALGALARYGAGIAAFRLVGAGQWPWGTFAVNLTGGLLIGLITGWLAFKGSANGENIRLFAVVGVLGGFTTFSAFSLEVVAMLERREMATAALYALASVILSVVAVFVGLTIMRKVFG